MDRELDFVNDRDQTGSRFKELDVGPFNSFVPSQYSSSFVKFFMPASEVYNWSKSHLDLTLTFPAVNDYTNYLFMGRNMLIQSMSLQYDGNNFPINMQDARISSSVTTLPQLDYESDYITRPQAVVAQTVDQLGGAARCELIQPIKKPSGTLNTQFCGGLMTSSVAADAAANLGAAGVLCGYANGIRCVSTGVPNANPGGRIVATCGSYNVMSIIAHTVAVAVGHTMGIVVSLSFTSNGQATNTAAGTVIGYLTGTAIPVLSIGAAATGLNIPIGVAIINYVRTTVIGNGTAIADATVCGHLVGAQEGSLETDAFVNGGQSIALDQAVQGGTLLPIAMDGSDSPCTAISPGPNLAMSIRIRINLSDFRNTLLAVNRTMCWPRNANLYFTFAPTQYWGYSVPNAAVGSSLAGAVPLLSVPSNPVTECILRVSVEKSQPLRVACMAMTESGFSLNFPQVTTNAYPIQSNSIGTYSYNLESALGHSVLRIYTAVLNTDVGANYLSPSNSVNYGYTLGVPSGLIPNQYSTFQSYLGTELLQDQQIRPITNDDYRFLKKMLTGSALTSNLNFSNFSFFLDNFTGAGYTHKYDESNCDKGGLPLIDSNGRTIQYNYRVQITNTNAGRAQVWFIIVSQNTITISPMGVHIGAAAAR